MGCEALLLAVRLENDGRLVTFGRGSRKNRSVAFTGHQDYDGRADGILRAVVYRLWSEGFRFFLSGMACGFDLAAAEAVLALRGECAGMELVAVVPFAGQPESFSDADNGVMRTS